MANRSPTPTPSAPPLQPSPVTTMMMGVASPAMVKMFSAMAMAWPRSSASTAQAAPGVSIRQMMGRWNFSASFIFWSALR